MRYGVKGCGQGVRPFDRCVVPAAHALLAAAIWLAGGCATSGDSNRGTIAVESDPAGARVYAEGKVIGTTPLHMRPGDHFETRAVFMDRKADAAVGIRYVGTLALEKPGCRRHEIEVDDAVLSKDIHVDLDCSNTSATPPEHYPAAAPEPLEPGAQKDARTRLQRIEALRRDGLITEEEYRKLRQRVLDSL